MINEVGIEEEKTTAFDTFMKKSEIEALFKFLGTKNGDEEFIPKDLTGIIFQSGFNAGLGFAMLQVTQIILEARQQKENEKEQTTK